MRFFESTEAGRPSGRLEATHRWGLPGVECSLCGATWADSGVEYPSVDLSSLPERELFVEPRAVPIEEYERLRALIRPHVAPDLPLVPGTELGPMQGVARGKPGALVHPLPWQWVFRGDALERLRSAGLRGLKPVRLDLRFREKNPPEFFELELAHHGKLHRDCLPKNPPPPCARCGRDEVTFPKEPILDAASLPGDVDIFRLAGYTTVVLSSERFVEAVRRLELEGLVFTELSQR